MHYSSSETEIEAKPPGALYAALFYSPSLSLSLPPPISTFFHSPI